MLCKLLVIALLSLSGCSFASWRDQTYQDLMAGRLRTDYSQIGPGGSDSQTIEFYDRGGRHTGYGVIHGGSIDVYGRDGSRKGFAR